ncbi:hypothetical protein AB0L35_35405 [Streptomyces sp. NPDC052309]|uniref:hypothetical protein n=1 Tax=Streptomyces sp. NPDC052309 TaxID=3155421 RepID=UPI003427B7B7
MLRVSGVQDAWWELLREHARQLPVEPALTHPGGAAPRAARWPPSRVRAGAWRGAPTSARRRCRDGRLPLEELGLIGDGATAALVGLDGSVPWLCVPGFDDEPQFCGLLDHPRGR